MIREGYRPGLPPPTLETPGACAAYRSTAGLYRLRGVPASVQLPADPHPIARLQDRVRLDLKAPYSLRIAIVGVEASMEPTADFTLNAVRGKSQDKARRHGVPPPVSESVGN